MSCALLLALLAGDPLPEGNAYVRGLVERQRRREEAVNRYTYDVSEVREELDGDGRRRSLSTARYEVFHDVLAPAILGWRATWNARRQAEAAARRQLERRARRWRRGQALAAVLIAVLVASLAALALRAARSDRAATTAKTAQAVAQRQAGRAAATAIGASVQAQRSAERAYVARADAVCAKGWAEGRLLGEPPARDDPGFGGWLGDMVQVGQKTLRKWSSVQEPPSMAGDAGRILGLYQESLTAYGFAAQSLAGGDSEEGQRLLDRGDRIGRQYQQLAARSGFQECDGALEPLAR